MNISMHIDACSCVCMCVCVCLCVCVCVCVCVVQPIWCRCVSAPIIISNTGDTEVSNMGDTSACGRYFSVKHGGVFSVWEML